MTDPAKCVTHYLDACDCQRERIRRLEAVVSVARDLETAPRRDVDQIIDAVIQRIRAFDVAFKVNP